jgi:hypothetical protein
MENHAVAEAEHPQAQGAKPLIALLVPGFVFWLEVLASIELDHELRDRALDVRERRQGFLPVESHPEHLPAADPLYQSARSASVSCFRSSRESCFNLRSYGSVWISRGPPPPQIF